MTFIGIKTTESSAEIATDTWRYTPGCRLTQGTKVDTILHLGMALVAQGDAVFRSQWHEAITSSEISTFDALAEAAPGALRDLWERSSALERQTPIVPTLIIHVGYSHNQGRYVALGFFSADDFEPVDLGDFWAVPSPIDVRPSEYELRRLRVELDDSLARYEESHPEWVVEVYEQETETLDIWGAKPPLTEAPTDPAQWAMLAERARTHRSHAPDGLKVLIGGSLHLTRIEQNGAVQASIYDFDNSTETLREIFAGTLHPLGLAGPCACGSGDRYIDCCLVAWLDEPCRCGVTETLREHCAAEVLAVEETHHEEVVA